MKKKKNQHQHEHIHQRIIKKHKGTKKIKKQKFSNKITAFVILHHQQYYSQCAWP